MAEDNQQAQQSIWNFDGAQLLLIYNLKETFTLSLMAWDLEQCYWILRSLRREFDAKLEGDSHKTDRTIIDEKLKELTNFRTYYLSQEMKTNEDKCKLFDMEEEFYMLICRTMKKHALYFRENRDPTKSILY